MPLVRSRPAHPADASLELLLQRAGQLRVPWQLGCLPGSQPVTALCWTAPTTRGRKSRVRVLFPPCVPRGSPEAPPMPPVSSRPRAFRSPLAWAPGALVPRAWSGRPRSQVLQPHTFTRSQTWLHRE